MSKTNKVDITDITEAPRKSLFERVAVFLAANDWRYWESPENDYFSLSFRIENASVRMIVDVHQDDGWERIMVYSVYPVFVPETRRSVVLEALNRINHGLYYGNFEMDPSDGEVRFRTTVELEGDISEGAMSRVLMGNLAGADKHFAQLMAVAFGVGKSDVVESVLSLPDTATLQ